MVMNLLKVSKFAMELINKVHEITFIIIIIY